MTDPRTRVTPTAFRIDPSLMGVALASPRRRLAALLVDLLLAAIVGGLGGGELAGLVAAMLFFRLAMRRGSRHPMRRLGRGALALTGALILFGLAASLIDRDDEPDDAPPVAASLSPDDAAEALDEADRNLAAMGLDLDSLLPGVAGDAVRKLRAAARADTTLDPAAVAALLHAYADAIARPDSAALDSLGPAARTYVAGAELRRKDAALVRLGKRLAALEDENERLTEEVDNPSFLRAVRALAADFGLSLGWVGVYFTLLLAVWGGYTPGKRLFGIRVLRLDGRPITLWTAFERFGGYAAGLATGLLGFAQVFWDPNRQAIHDKIAATVVVRMRDRDTPRRSPVAPEAPGEALSTGAE